MSGHGCIEALHFLVVSVLCTHKTWIAANILNCSHDLRIIKASSKVRRLHDLQKMPRYSTYDRLSWGLGFMAGADMVHAVRETRMATRSKSQLWL